MRRRAGGGARRFVAASMAVARRWPRVSLRTAAGRPHAKEVGHRPTAVVGRERASTSRSTFWGGSVWGTAEREQQATVFCAACVSYPSTNKEKRCRLFWRWQNLEYWRKFPVMYHRLRDVVTGCSDKVPSISFARLSIERWCAVAVLDPSATRGLAFCACSHPQHNSGLSLRHCHVLVAPATFLDTKRSLPPWPCHLKPLSPPSAHRLYLEFLPTL